MRLGMAFILGIEFKWSYGKWGKGIDLGGEYIGRVNFFG